MSRYVAQGLCKVVGSGYDTVFTYDDGTYRYFAFFFRFPSLIQGLEHKLLILFLLFLSCHVKCSSVVK